MTVAGAGAGVAAEAGAETGVKAGTRAGPEVLTRAGVWAGAGTKAGAGTEAGLGLEFPPAGLSTTLPGPTRTNAGPCRAGPVTVAVAAPVVVTVAEAEAGAGAGAEPPRVWPCPVKEAAGLGADLGRGPPGDTRLVPELSSWPIRAALGPELVAGAAAAAPRTRRSTPAQTGWWFPSGSRQSSSRSEDASYMNICRWRRGRHTVRRVTGVGGGSAQLQRPDPSLLRCTELGR